MAKTIGSSTITLNEVRSLLRFRTAAAPSAREAAAVIGISPAFLSSILSGRSKPSPRVLQWLGLQRVERYIPLDAEDR